MNLNNVSSNFKNNSSENISLNRYDFFHLFSAILRFEDETKFDKKYLLNFICYCKKNKRFETLLSDFSITIINNSVCSLEFDDAINKLIGKKIFGEHYQNSNSIINFMDDRSSNSLICSNLEYFNLICDFFDDFQYYEFAMLTDQFCQIYEQEDNLLKSNRKVLKK